MKRHTTRKRNRRIKRVANRKFVARMEQVLNKMAVIISRPYFSGKVIDMIDITPTLPIGQIFYQDITVENKSEISTTVED